MAGYHESVGGRFAVASGCRYASEAAADVLRDGGNVVDAALAGSAVLCVTLPHAVSIGGDLFALIKTPGREIVALNATGAAPAKAEISFYRARGHGAVPERGALSIQPPGLIAGWQGLLDGWASLPLPRLLQPAIALARDGFRVGSRLARLSAQLSPVCSLQNGWADTYLRDGKAPAAGDLLKQERLASTLAAIADQGTQAFFRGRIADDIVATVVRAGGIIARSDLEEIRPQVGPPITVRIGDKMIATQPPISQGVVLLRALSLFAAQLANKRGDIGRLWPRAARSLQTAFAERFAVLGDTAHSFQLAQAMVEGRLANAPRGSIEMANTGTETTTISVIDNEGNSAALILSIFAEFGSGIVTEETGILLNNRLTGFFLDEKHPNGLAPRKRAMHTLHSVMVLDGDSPVLAGGTPGADAQPQVNLQVLSRVLFRGQDLGAACAEPRWMISPAARPAGQPSAIDVQCESDLDAETRTAFEREGFSTKLMTRGDIGSAKWVMRQGRELVAACDTRRDAAVAAE